jgi:Tfp pilus assembly protein PilO
VLLILIIGLFYWFVVQPKKNEKKAHQLVLVQAQEQQAKLSSQLRILEELIAELRSHSKDVEKLDEALPLEMNNIRLQLLLETIARNSGLTVADVVVNSRAGSDVVAGNRELLKNPYKTGRTLQKANVAVGVIGTFDQIRVFLEKIEKNSKVLDIISMDLQALKENSLQLGLNIETYYFSN